MNRWLRQELADRGVLVPSERLPSVDMHLLKRIHLDRQWPPGTTVAQCIADLYQAIQHPEVHVWTSRWLDEVFAGFLAPSHIQNVPHAATYIFVAYSAAYGVLKTGCQASSHEAICTETLENLPRHTEERLMDLQVYGSDHIASFLLNYKLLVRDLAEVAATWPDLDAAERGHHRAALMEQCFGFD